jgi:hypothetical protein
MSGIDVRLTRVGPGRSQGYTVFLGTSPIAYYDRDPVQFSQMFHVLVLAQGKELGYRSVDTEDPLIAFLRQHCEIEARKQLAQELPNVSFPMIVIEERM